MDLRGRLAELQMQERRQRTDSHMASGAGSVSGRDREADVMTVDLAVEVIDTKAKIAALEDQRDLFHLAITHGVELIQRG